MTDINQTINVQEADRKRIEEAQKQAKGKYRADWIQKALMDVYDIQERSLVNFILLGDLAKACKENKSIEAEEIELTIPKSAITYELKSLFHTWKFEERPYGYEYFYTPELQWTVKIPVKIYVYSSKFKFFDNPNRVWGTTEGFYIPNPFEGYWKARHLIHGKLKKSQI